jgi:calcium/calmodulin-dependent protein kinase I
MPGILERFQKKKKDSENEQAPASNRIFNVNDAKIGDHYVIKNFLGKGSFSTVKLGTSKKTKEDVAIKIIEKNSIDIKVESLKTEVKILMNVKHPNIVNLLDVFEDNDKVYLLMELMTGGELFDRICNDFPNGYSEKQSSILIRKIIAAVKYLHEKGIIHRDLKPENLLFTTPDKDSAEIKISDFGLAKSWSGDMLVKTACGSPNYVAPEVLLNEKHGYSFACDMWSVGVVLYVLLCGFCPFFDECTPALFASITSGNYSFPSPYWDDISDDAKDLVRNLLVVDPTKRYTPDQALAHRWLVNNQSDSVNPNVTENMKKLKDNRSFTGA